MRKIIVAIGLLFLCGSAQARPANAFKTAVTKLNAMTDTTIAWNTAKAKTADVTCSGDDDKLLFGSSKTSVWIGIVPAKGTPQLMDFPVNSNLRDGFCARPKKISVSPLSCEGGKLDGCRPVKSCKQFAVDDEKCAPFNFYWDSSHGVVRWSRN